MACSDLLHILSGVLQGTTLSPSHFNLHVDIIIDALSKAGYGCFLRKIYMSASSTSAT